MKHKPSPTFLRGIHAVALVIASQVWLQGVFAQEGAVSVDEATSADPFGDSTNSAATESAAPPALQPASQPYASQPAATQPASALSESPQPASAQLQDTPPSAVPSKASSLATSTLHRAPEPSKNPSEEYGPPNYLKVWKNPFGSQSGPSTNGQSGDDGDTITLTPARRLSPVGQLRKNLVSSKLYLPERILIGESSKFTVRGPANWRVAIAMADKDEGAKPINDLKIRLGADRKVVAIGKIPPTGVLELYVATPIQGDLIGTYLYFEAALWSKDDLSDTQIAETVPSVISNNPSGNGVQIAALKEKKRGFRFVPDASIQTQTNPNSLGSGNP